MTKTKPQMLQDVLATARKVLRETEDFQAACVAIAGSEYFSDLSGDEKDDKVTEAVSYAERQNERLSA